MIVVFSLVAISVVGLVSLVWWQGRRWQEEPIVVSQVLDWSTLLLWRPLDYLTIELPHLFRRGVKLGVVYILLFLRRGLISLKHGLVWLEKHSSTLIDLVHSQRGHQGKTSSSFFLEEIKFHQDKMRREATPRRPD
ncbi:MAG: hypothetical protein AAB468_02125 [Patescibacteria group bacterium]